MPRKVAKPKDTEFIPSEALLVLAANLKVLQEFYADRRSQEAIAKKAGINQRTVGRILNKEHEPSLAQVAKLAAVFELDPPWKLLVPGLVPSNPPMLATNSAAMLELLKSIGGTKEAIEGYLREEGSSRPGGLDELI